LVAVTDGQQRQRERIKKSAFGSQIVRVQPASPAQPRGVAFIAFIYGRSCLKKKTAAKEERALDRRLHQTA
jgi:hypothetical protein